VTRGLVSARYWRSMDGDRWWAAAMVISAF
jgi:hypothetical protein